jgi:hypothetical protein
MPFTSCDKVLGRSQVFIEAVSDRVLPNSFCEGRDNILRCVITLNRSSRFHWFLALLMFEPFSEDIIFTRAREKWNMARDYDFISSQLCYYSGHPKRSYERLFQAAEETYAKWNSEDPIYRVNEQHSSDMYVSDRCAQRFFKEHEREFWRENVRKAPSYRKVEK